MIKRKLFEAILSTVVLLWCCMNGIFGLSCFVIVLPLVMSCAIQCFVVWCKALYGSDN